MKASGNNHAPAKGSDLLEQLMSLDAQAIGALRSNLESVSLQRLAPQLVLWLLNELNDELERRIDMKVSAPKLPDLPVWSDPMIGRSLGVALCLHEHTVSDLEDEFVKSLVHLLAKHAAARLEIKGMASGPKNG